MKPEPQPKAAGWGGSILPAELQLSRESADHRQASGRESLLAQLLGILDHDSKQVAGAFNGLSLFSNHWEWIASYPPHITAWQDSETGNWRDWKAKNACLISAL